MHGRKTAGTSIGISLMRYLSSGDIVRGYITGGLKHKIKPPDWNKSLYYMRIKDLFCDEPHASAYRRYVKKIYNVPSTHLSVSEVIQLVGKDLLVESGFKSPMILFGSARFSGGK